ncbi:MAG: heavy metal-binding domain-containing protein [Methylotenera sp.]
MKTTQFLAITTLLIAVMGCSKQENQEAIDTPTAEKSMEVMPSETEGKPTQMLPNEIKADDTTSVIEQDGSGRKVIYWYDPMLEDRHFSKSGQSPFMDMKLAPQYAAEEVNKGGQP